MNDGTANFFFRNLGGFRFEETSLAAGLAGNDEGGYQAGMGVAAGASRVCSCWPDDASQTPRTPGPAS